MNKRVAILDLGTNTFHLKVIEHDGAALHELYATKVFVKLAENGIEHIGEEPFERALEVLHVYKNEIDEFHVDETICMATAALRNADNSQAFMNRVERETGIQIQIISGDREAELIHKGVAQAIELPGQPVLIMDIGGGSVEFILATSEDMLWRQSFPIGAAVMRNHFHKTEPITPEETLALQMWLSEQLAPLFKEIGAHSINVLIGASGAFESISEMIACEFLSPDHLDGKISFPIDVDKYTMMRDRILSATLEERLEFKGLVPMRAEMIVVAVLLIDLVIRKVGIKEMHMSAYALKEGVASELFA
jgi:exopolyphosphatase/guanosine-5'-triphosphate,3'-diphosphate pyrophosphatase